MGYDLDQFAVKQSSNRNEIGKRKADDMVPTQPATAPWQVTGPFDARRWVDILNRYNVDMEAQATLFLLCQHSEAGARAANALIFKLVKGTMIDNPSAFVMSSAIRAYHKVQDEFGEGRTSWQQNWRPADPAGDDDDDDAWGDWHANDTGASSSA